MMITIPKDAIFSMRKQGRTYQEIAGQLDLSPNTVKSLCRRNGISIAVPEKSTLDICKCCGSPLRRSGKRRQKSFCSDKCRYAWWNDARSKQPYRLTCHHCGKQFISYGNRKRKFCGRECYLLGRYGEGLP